MLPFIKHLWGEPCMVSSPSRHLPAVTHLRSPRGWGVANAQGSRAGKGHAGAQQMVVHAEDQHVQRSGEQRHEKECLVLLWARAKVL